MAMIKCPECQRDVSDRATTCPGCGCPCDPSGDGLIGEQTNFQTLVEKPWVCDRCRQPQGRVILNGGKDVSKLVWAAGVLVLAVVLVAWGISQPEDSAGYKWAGRLMLVAAVGFLVFLYQGLRTQDLVLCRSCGHKAFMMIDRKA